jgi:nucleoside-diphosphate-sugar epimerase
VIFAASSSAYGHTATLPKAETMPARPLSPYAASKTAGEAWVRAYTNSYELDAVSLRYFNIFGPRQNANSAYAAVIAAFAKALRRNEQAWIHGDGEQSRDFTYVENAIEANLLAARAAGPLQGEVLNVGCGERITVTELFHLMRRLAGQGESMMPEYGQARAADVRHSLADLTQIDQTLGYAPIVPITAGLEQTLAWYRQSLGEPAEAKADSGTSE